MSNEAEKKYVIDSIKDYILTCPYLEELTTSLGIDFLNKDSDSFSVEEVPGQSTVHKMVDGSKEKQLTFVFASIFDFSEELEIQLKNSGFFEDFSDWIEENEDNGIYPQLRDGLIPESIEVVTSGYLYGIVDGIKKARYQIQCKFTYRKRGKSIWQ